MAAVPQGSVPKAHRAAPVPQAHRASHGSYSSPSYHPNLGPKIHLAPLREGPWLRLRVNRATHPAHTQSGGPGENRCS